MSRRAQQPRMFWEAFTKAYPVKATALALVVVLLVVVTGREGTLSRGLTLNYDSLPGKAPKPTKPAEKLHVAVRQLKGLLTVQAKRELSKKQAEHARAARAQIATQLHSLARQFEADRVKLGKLGAKAALARLGNIQSRTAGIQHSLQATLTQVPTNGAQAAAPAAKAAKLLTALSPDKPQQPLSSDLAFGIKNAKPRSVSLSAGITPAYNSPTSTEAASELPRTPEPEDLAQTGETKITPAVHALAQQLGGDPVRIYAYVHNNISFEPYYGIRKGADQTLAEKSGSDADQAALLIALLRDSGIHARFVQGTAQLPAARFANWLGVNVQGGERLDAAPDILASGGIPTTQSRANGQLIKVRFDHIWAEAYVPNDAYRGTEERLGSKTWLPLDPSIKQMRFEAPRTDVKQVLEPAVADWAHDVASGSQFIGSDAIIAPPQAQMEQRTQALIAQEKSVLSSHGVTNSDGISALIGSREIVPSNPTYLPGSTPFKQLAVAGERRTLPDTLASSVSLEVSGSDPLAMPSFDPQVADGAGFSFTAKTSDLANKRITIGYAPATESDAEVIDAYHGLLNAPTYAAALIPVLRVDGRVVARGHQAVSTGYTQNFRIVYRTPGFAADEVRNPIAVGALSAVSLDLGRKDLTQVRQRATALKPLAEQTTTDNVLTDARAGEMMSIMGDLYFARNDQHNAVLARIGGVDARRGLSGAIVATSLRTTLLAGFPVFTALGGANFDVDEDVQSVTGLTANDNAPQLYMRASGLNTSLSEGQILEHVFRSPAASTTKILSVAAGKQIPIYQIDSSNVDAVAPQLTIPAAVVTQIRAAVSQGATVAVPKSGVTLSGWTGTGYVVTNGTSSDYRIYGGASGGSWEPEPIPIPVIPLDKKSLVVWVLTFLGFPESVASCIALVLDILGVWAFGTGFAELAASVAVFLEAALFFPAALALVAAILLIATAFVLSALYEWNDAIACRQSIEDALGR